ncbi:MAG: cytoplasmic protein [Glaciihabitans sp.]|nr:cytoplasmic protein [Glaciihabitans sp.]
MSRILIAGESWITTSTHIKGVDEFTAHSYTEGVGQLRTALQSGGHEVVHLPGHLVPANFPETQDQLSEYDVIVLSDIGANSLQLAPNVFDRAIPGRDRLGELATWVRGGGSLLMIGGYLSFSGFQARAAFQHTAIVDVLPVSLLEGDDRFEAPAGLRASVVEATHPALGGVDTEWPLLLGYNKTVLKQGSTLVATINGDPLVAVAQIGAGRSAVFTSDCSPHWAPLAFCEEWPGYSAVFNGIVGWLTAR